MQADFGLLIVRLVFGLYMIGHGAQKLFGWHGGHGLLATAGFFDQLGFRPGRVFATVASTTEIMGGLLLALGLLGPVGPALVISVMIVAIGSVHWQHGLFTLQNGVELPLMYASAAFAIGLTGPGIFSLDDLLGLERIWTGDVTWLILALGILGGLGNLTLRRPSRELAPGR